MNVFIFYIYIIYNNYHTVNTVGKKTIFVLIG